MPLHTARVSTGVSAIHAGVTRRDDMSLARKAGKIFDDALSAAQPDRCIEEHLTLDKGTLRLKGTKTCFDLSSFSRIILVGAGKATIGMAEAVLRLLDGTAVPLCGVISVTYGQGKKLPPLDVLEAGHPCPDPAGHEAAKKIRALLSGAKKNELVVSLISGGGSALLPLPAGDISLEEKSRTTELLLASGAEIDEINTVRKHISLIKGGQLAEAAYPAAVCNLLLSDVRGNRPDTIASGPFVPDDTTFSDARSILEKFGLIRKVPRTVLSYIEEGRAGKRPETPGTGHHAFSRVFTNVIGSNLIILEAAKKKAEALGFHTLILTSSIRGEARELGLFLSEIAREIREHGRPVPPPACILAGGETTVTLKGNGRGGRNQECCLAAVSGIAGLTDVLVFCAGTDGTDGPTGAAGAFCTGETLDAGRKTGIEAEDYLRTNDSYNYFRQTGNLVVTGPTGTNYMDIYMVLAG